MEGAEPVESPRKRLKTDNASSSEEAVLPGAAAESAPAKISESDAQAMKELEVGITHFVRADNEGFSGVLKKRYTDFLVNEIVPSGEVLHLRNVILSTPNENEDGAAKPTTEGVGENKEEEKPEPAAEEAPKEKKQFELSEEDKTLMEELFGEPSTKKIVGLHNRAQNNDRARPSELGKIPTVVVDDRDLRVKMHQAIRRIFKSQLESSTDADGMMTISAAPNRNKRSAKAGPAGAGRDRGRVNWDELGGPYLHFTIYKENKDTMEVISFISRQLRMNPKSFQFAGTKDRRGVTVQRACAHRVQAERLTKLNACLRNAVIGDFEYRQQGLELGDLNGNEFVVTLRECDIPGLDLENRETAVAKASDLVGSALWNLRERGYFNYYGLQRFGTFATRTDTVGVKMLQSDFKGAVDAILDYSSESLEAAEAGENATSLISSDDKARAKAIHMFRTSDKCTEALDILPRKFSAESNLIRHLSRSRNDCRGALQTIPRNLRLMYVHAYQSLVWNFAAGERWRLYGDKVVEGDLVLVHEHRDKEGDDNTASNVDADGEVIIAPGAADSSFVDYTRARALTADEAASGKYTVFDVVLPLPGFDVLYPANAMTEWYKTFMASEQGGGLDPFDMRRQWKDISLSGSYRKLLSRMGPDFSCQVHQYSQDDEQFIQTDLQKLQQGQEGAVDAASSSGDKIAVVLKFQLGSSQYATMALRELMKGKVKAYKPDFSGRA
ncbi:pseudouridine synthase TruD/Pus7 [Aspergillus steynii IBT 23096]|uniref:Pseudouridine synthase TruD/Pus7 n=1 Tax=Aspergillus steynii IBT 23096 TaxID=1392250 RepID=A0A2I2FVC2_9EURO|nr:pseudouridine synthase TruD/Pus7 [Aspergillus steynii IBT 23096]PLB44590.1 pseudouridine synthase TruD/Pus7 [Aspergillus steynii IBT 23096]